MVALSKVVAGNFNSLSNSATAEEIDIINYSD